MIERSRRAHRPRFLTTVFIALVPVTALLGTGGLLYGQGTADALFVDARGWIGIGTNDPKATLDVAGKVNVSADAAVAGSLTTATLNVTKEASLADTTIKGTLTATGRGVIGNAFVGDVGHGDNWAGFSHSKSASTTGYGVLQDTAGQFTLINKKSGGGGFIGFRIDNADKMVVADNGNVGIGTATPRTTLDVAGAVIANSVNGEKRPLIFEVGQRGDTQRWYALNQDIGQLCGDIDGCTIKLFLRENSTDNVRTISEQIYIEQVDKSMGRTPGLQGWTKEFGGGGEFAFTLNATAKNTIAAPWDWIYIRNYQSPEAGPESAAFRGYLVQFMTRPNYSATVIIYDR